MKRKCVREKEREREKRRERKKGGEEKETISVDPTQMNRA